MNLNSLFALAAGALVLAGCSTPAKVDSGAIHATTFSFVNPGPRNMPGYADKAQPVHAKIQQAITSNLGQRGVTKVDSGGDVTVGYLLIVGNNASITSISDYFGDREELSALENKAHDAYNDTKNPNYFEAGTLVIDIIDSKTYKLLSRGHATRPTLQNPSEEARAARVQEAVDDILRNVRLER